MLETINSAIYRFLKWSEKYTNTDMVYLYEGGRWLLLDNALTFISSFILSIAYANLLPQEAYGSYRYVLSVLNVLVIFTLPGMNTAVTRAVGTGDDQSLLEAFRSRLRWGVLVCGLISAIGLYYLLQDDGDLAVGFILVAIAFPLMEAFGLYHAYLVGKENFARAAKFRMGLQFSSLAILLTTLALTDSFILVLAAYFVPRTLLNFLFFVRIRSNIVDTGAQTAEVISYGKQLTATDVVAVIATYIDRLIVFNLLGSADLAVYSFAIAPPEQIKFVLKIINPLALPRFSRRSKAELVDTIWGKMVRFGIVILGITAIYIFLAPWFFRLFFPAYISAIDLSRLFAVSLISYVSYLPQTLFRSKKMVSALYRFNLFTSIVQILLLIVLTPAFGLVGTVSARVLARLGSLIFVLTMIKQIDIEPDVE